jgi:hypothetical protein
MVNNLWVVVSYISTSEVLQLLLLWYCQNIRVYVYSPHTLIKLKNSIGNQLGNTSHDIHYMYKKNQKVWDLLKLFTSGFKWLQSTFVYDILFAGDLNFSTRVTKNVNITGPNKVK